ncbi:Gfo/Idh/MocA family oxidoreductase [Actinoallomurus sp. NPDC050550]|uniref:Gfo/Idh/MocA family oxidoreductase n=1 Tax=Actinoallomurus sp. NPDC050550 TaxID=3154937 RepID=UPI00340477D9
MSEIRVGVIGTGIMGADHVNTLHRHVSGAAVTVVADIDPARARAVAVGVPDARTVDDAFALIADPAVDAVVIASHDATHADLAIAAVRAGKPVMCEKPLAPTLAECARVVRAEERTGLISLGFMRRFDPAYVELRAALAAGACGVPLLLHCVSRGVASAPGATSESSVTGSAIHEFDTVPWLLDSPVTEVEWRAPRRTPAATGLRDPQLILLRTADGALTTVEVFLNAGYGYDIRCEIVGDRGTVALADPARIVTDAERRRATGHPADWRPRFADAYRLELQTWVDAIAAGTPSPLATARDGLTASAVAAAVIDSMRNGGRTVPVQAPAL